MPAKCFVPKCTSGYDSNKTKRHLFAPPTEPDEFEKWCKAIPRSDRTLSQKSRVCDLHFSQDLIIKVDTFVINGKVATLPREKPKLAPNAIPHIFPNCPKYLSKYVKKRKPPAKRVPPPRIVKSSPMQSQDDTTPTPTTNEPSGSGQKSSKTGKSIWDKATVRLLLSLVREGKGELKNPQVKKKDFWQETALKMNMKGKNVSGCDVDRKFSNLFDTYRKCKDRKSGEGAITWDYYNDFESIYNDDDPSIITSDVQIPASIPSFDSESSSASASSVVAQESPVSTFRRGSKRRLRADSSQPDELTVVDVLDLGRQQRAEFIDIAKRDLAIKCEMLALAKATKDDMVALAKERVELEKAKVQAEEKYAAQISNAIRYLADAIVKNK